MKKTTFYLVLAFFFGVTNLVSAQWTQRGSDIDGEATGDNSGHSVAINEDGSIVAVGAYKNDSSGIDAGHVRVYENIAGSWVQKGSDIDGETAGDWSGFNIGMNASGSILVIGSHSNDEVASNAGKVHVYEFISGNWQQMGADINGEAYGDYSGYSVDIDESGMVIAVGAYGSDVNGNGSGQVKIYTYSAGNWVQKGSTINGEAGGDYSCIGSLNADGSIVAIGAFYSSGNGSYSGSGRIFEFTGGDWVQIGARIDGQAENDYFGMSSSINSTGNIVAFGARSNDANGIYNSGQVRVYENIGSNWVQKGNSIDGEVASEESGEAISLSSDGLKIAVGCKKNSSGGTYAGAVKIFEFKNNDWVLMGSPIWGEAGNDFFGYAVRLDSDGSNVAIGGYGNGSLAGHARVYYNCNTYNTINITTCDSIYISPSGDYEWTTNGTYYDTVTNNELCDSMIMVNLSFNSAYATVTQNFTVLSADTSGVQYQWVDCNNAYSEINGETNQTFTANQNGSYALVQTQNGCSDTSTCYSITTIGISENYFDSEFSVFSDPTSGHIIVKGQGIEKIELFDIQGKKVYVSSIESEEYNVDLKNNKGLFIVVITTSKGVVSEKVTL